MKKRLYFFDFENFGDALSPYLMRHLMKCDIVPATAANADIMAVGSLFFTGEYFFFDRSNIFSRQALKWLWYKLKGLWQKPLVVWGSAFLYEPKIPKKCLHYRKLDIKAVRGKITKSLLQQAGYGLLDDVVLGDPGLFYPELLGDWRKIEKVYDLAIVPSHSDLVHGAALSASARKLGLNVKVVNVMQEDPMQTLREIAESKVVIGSAMHALIVADSMGIPNRVVDFPKYNLWKITDYYSAFDKVPEEPIHYRECMGKPELFRQLLPRECRISEEEVERVKAQLRKVLKEAF